MDVSTNTTCALPSHNSITRMTSISVDIVPVGTTHRSWRPYRTGPAVARIYPVSRFRRSLLNSVWRWPWRGRKTLIRTVVRLSGAEVDLLTPWGGRFRSPWNDTFFLQGACCEPLESFLLARLVHRGDVVCDVGANRGWYTLLLAKLVGTSGVVHAFEPHPQAHSTLLETVSLNSFASNVRLNEIALSNESGIVAFELEDESEISRLSCSGNDARSHRVPCRTLSSYLHDQGSCRLDFVKIDVEGAEGLVLQGALSLIDEGIRPVFMVEVIERNLSRYEWSSEKLRRCLELRGYRWYWIDYQMGLVTAASSKTLCANNMFAIPEERDEEFRELMSGERDLSNEWNG